MKRIPLDQAEPGMILAQKVVRHDGVLLCQKGSALTEQMVRMLERMNFETVAVEEENQETPEERSERLAQEMAKINERFARVEGHPVLSYLKKALIKRLREEG